MQDDWVSLHLAQRGKKGPVTRCKYRYAIYSDVVIPESTQWNYEEVKIMLMPVKNDYSKKKRGLPYLMDYEAIIKTSDLDEGQIIAEKYLDIILLLVKGKFHSHQPIRHWVECENEWVGLPNMMLTASVVLTLRKDFINENRDFFYDLCESLDKNDKISKKILKCKELLISALRIQSLWPNESFLNFYKVLEMIADELKKEKYHQRLILTDTIREFFTLGFMEKPSQRMKMFFLYHVLCLDKFDKYKFVSLGDIRNKVAHTPHQPESSDVQLCNEASFEVFKLFLAIKYRKRNSEETE